MEEVGSFKHTHFNDKGMPRLNSISANEEMEKKQQEI